MSAQRYFALGPVAGTPHQRYAVLDGAVVVRIDASRPDGQEIERPEQVHFALRPAFGSGGSSRIQAAAIYNNVGGPALDAARQRAAEKGRRALEERRTLMSSESDEKLALARSRGAFRRAA